VSIATVALSGSAAWLIVRSAQRPALLSLTMLMGVVQLLALGKAAGRYGERVSTHQAALRIMARVRAMTALRLEPLVPAGLGRAVPTSSRRSSATWTRSRICS